MRTNITAFKFQGGKKSCYTNLVKLKRVWKQKPNQTGCMYAAKQQQASLKVVLPLKNLHSLTSLNARTTFRDGAQRCRRCTQAAPSPPGCSALLPGRLVIVRLTGQATRLPGTEVEGKERGEKGRRRADGDTDSGSPLEVGRGRETMTWPSD